MLSVTKAGRRKEESSKGKLSRSATDTAEIATRELNRLLVLYERAKSLPGSLFNEGHYGTILRSCRETDRDSALWVNGNAGMRINIARYAYDEGNEEFKSALDDEIETTRHDIKDAHASILDIVFASRHIEQAMRNVSGSQQSSFRSAADFIDSGAGIQVLFSHSKWVSASISARSPESHMHQANRMIGNLSENGIETQQLRLVSDSIVLNRLAGISNALREGMFSNAESMFANGTGGRAGDGLFTPDHAGIQRRKVARTERVAASWIKHMADYYREMQRNYDIEKERKIEIERLFAELYISGSPEVAKAMRSMIDTERLIHGMGGLERDEMRLLRKAMDGEVPGFRDPDALLAKIRAEQEESISDKRERIGIVGRIARRLDVPGRISGLLDRTGASKQARRASGLANDIFKKYKDYGNGSHE